MAPTNLIEHKNQASKVLFETFFISVFLTTSAAVCLANGWLVLTAVFGALQGIWLQRHYCVGHEASHGKLHPTPLANSFWGQAALLPLLVPLPVFRKIHRFHHGHNRRDNHTSALEVFVVPKNTLWRRVYANMVWYSAVFAGGWFWHSVVSILLFLAMPVSISKTISPAFNGWTQRQRLTSILMFVVALFLHGLCFTYGGVAFWFAVAGWPLVVFANVYSIQLYIYHYRTTIGPKVTMHSRRLSGAWVSWWLLNLNEHDTHHRRPNVVWYELLDHAQPLPPEFIQNQNVTTFWQGIKQQLRGPIIVEKPS